MLSRIFLVSCLSLLAIQLRASPIVYAITGSLEFGQIDVATGSFSSMSSIPPTIQYLVGRPNGSLLTMSFDGNLESINPATGTISVIGATGFTACTTPDLPTCGDNSQLSLGAAGGTVYATDFANRLYSVNPLTGKATLIGNTGIPAVPFIPASITGGHLNFYDENLFDFGGSLYANFDAGTFDFATQQTTPVIASALYRINTTTGAATKVADTEFGLITITGVNGVIYGFSGPNGQVVTLDVTNGKTNVVSDLDPSLGLIGGAAAVPEPASIVLSGFGLAGGLLWARRRQQMRSANR
jgi:hypothetical protein